MTGLSPSTTFLEAANVHRSRRMAEELAALNLNSPGSFKFPTAPSHSHFARSTSAAIARADFDRFEDAFLPLLREAAESVGNASIRNEQIGESMGLAQAGIDRSDRAYQRDLKERGIELNADQQQSYDRKMDLEGGLAQIDAANRTRRRIRDRDFSLAAGGAALRTRYDENGGPRTL